MNPREKYPSDFFRKLLGAELLVEFEDKQVSGILVRLTRANLFLALPAGKLLRIPRDSVRLVIMRQESFLKPCGVVEN